MWHKFYRNQKKRNYEERLPVKESSPRRFRMLSKHLLVDFYQFFKKYLKIRKERREKYYPPREEKRSRICRVKYKPQSKRTGAIQQRQMGGIIVGSRGKVKYI